MASRVQLRFGLQGMTLDYVKVSLANIFAIGQAYVALSRATSLDGLQITDWNDTCVKASSLHPKTALFSPKSSSGHSPLHAVGTIFSMANPETLSCQLAKCAGIESPWVKKLEQTEAVGFCSGRTMGEFLSPKPSGLSSDANWCNLLQTSDVVMRFHDCLMKGEEFNEDVWEKIMTLPSVPTPAGTSGRQASLSTCSGCALQRTMHPLMGRLQTWDCS